MTMVTMMTKCIYKIYTYLHLCVCVYLHLCIYISLPLQTFLVPSVTIFGNMFELKYHS